MHPHQLAHQAAVTQTLHESQQVVPMKRLRQMLTAQKIPGRARKGINKRDRIQLLMDHKAPILPSYEQLLRFWYDHSAPQVITE